ncbi:MAG: ABC transporter ATP-binding protein [Bacteroidota bacterium]
MKHLRALNPYFYKYRWRLLIGVVFVVSSNFFAVLAPRITGLLIGYIKQRTTTVHQQVKASRVDKIFSFLFQSDQSLTKIVTITCLLILLFAVIRGVFMFFMRQTIIVMSRHIEFDQKNEIYRQYQALHSGFFSTHATGDLMNRISEDVSRVRMFTGPALMYLINLITLIGFCLYNMFSRDVSLSLMVLAPLPILAFTIYRVNSIINKKSEEIQEQLSDLTTHAQETYSGIRVIKSFVQETAMFQQFRQSSEAYKRAAIGLSKVESIYFPSMSLMIGISILITIFIGSYRAIQDPSAVGTIVEFVIYINLLTFPVSAIGWTASMIQRAAASQKRINEFLSIVPDVHDPVQPVPVSMNATLTWSNVSFTFPHTGIKALQNIDCTIQPGEKVLVLGKTGSGKTTFAQLMMRMYDPTIGEILWGETPLHQFRLDDWRRSIGYVQQDVVLFSDTIAANISFGCKEMPTAAQIEQAARMAGVHNDIMGFPDGYATRVGERGITLSGGQKQRVSIARALLSNPQYLLLDDCLSAVDTATEALIAGNLHTWLGDKTLIFITHRIITSITFTQILVLENGRIVEQGNQEELLQKGGYYARLYRQQLQAVGGNPA